ncbi:DUF2141 domain-containing protein [Thauera sp. ZXT1-4]|jgi:uncharacterized protein (DUF2141 family)|uniref:DUF2141 domain-containing protein n=1 Tax=Thauera sp. ZXT1-4 TaxID=3460294 RepID=UPI00404089BF
MKHSPTRLATLVLAAALGCSTAHAAAPLEVQLTGVQHARGAIRVGLYADDKTFRKEAQALALQQVPATPGNVVVRFDDLAPSRYAIMAYHDEDGNGEMNRRFGMFPTEGYGLSNNPQVVGPPAFADSAFEAGEKAHTITIELRY